MSSDSVHDTATGMHLIDAQPTGAVNVDETILFLHCGNVGGWMWGPQRDELPEYHHLVPDMPGYGKSNDMRWQSVAKTADLLADLVRARAHGGRAHVVGLSLGALVGVVLVAKHPDVVLSAVLSGAPVRGLGPVMRGLSLLQLKLWKFAAYWSLQGRAYGLPGEALDEFVENGIGIDPVSARTMVNEVNRGIAHVLHDLHGTPVPILAVAGERESRVVTGALAEFGRAESALLRLAPRMHHVWNVEDPGLFSDMVRAWVTHGKADDRLRDVAARVARAADKHRR